MRGTDVFNSVEEFEKNYRLLSGADRPRIAFVKYADGWDWAVIECFPARDGDGSDVVFYNSEDGALENSNIQAIQPLFPPSDNEPKPPATHEALLSDMEGKDPKMLRELRGAIDEALGETDIVRMPRELSYTDLQKICVEYNTAANTLRISHSILVKHFGN